ncbi:hypothetical protein HK096_007239 [Nowakowskiella sp. JEL0078]|nr:hypothetical protein HK096_007239 [Nowakowskiella sp. JEL0078]
MDLIITKNVPYIAHATQQQQLDLYISRNSKLSSKIPVLVYIHGGFMTSKQVIIKLTIKILGAWRTGDRNEYEFLGKSLTNSGFPTAVIGYRLSSNFNNLRHPSHLEDVATAIRFLVSKEIEVYFGFVPERLYLIGHSAGAQITGILVLQSQKWLGDVSDCIKGVIGVEGIYDIPGMITDYPSYREFVELAFGPQDQNNVWEAASPLYCELDRLDSNFPAYLIIHSLEDELLKPDPSVQFFNFIQKFGGLAVINTELCGNHFGILKTKIFLDCCLDFVRGVEFGLQRQEKKFEK